MVKSLSGSAEPERYLPGTVQVSNKVGGTRGQHSSGCLTGMHYLRYLTMTLHYISGILGTLLQGILVAFIVLRPESSMIVTSIFCDAVVALRPFHISPSPPFWLLFLFLSLHPSHPVINLTVQVEQEAQGSGGKKTSPCSPIGGGPRRCSHDTAAFPVLFLDETTRSQVVSQLKV